MKKQTDRCLGVWCPIPPPKKSQKKDSIPRGVWCPISSPNKSRLHVCVAIYVTTYICITYTVKPRRASKQSRRCRLFLIPNSGDGVLSRAGLSIHSSMAAQINPNQAQIKPKSSPNQVLKSTQAVNHKHTYHWRLCIHIPMNIYHMTCGIHNII